MKSRTAVIDLGSNTARLIVVEAAPGYAYRLVDEIREVVRLREGLDESGLSVEAQERAFSTLRFFARFCETVRAHPVLATATSAVREAANGAAFAARVQAELGLTLRVLDGETEARYGVIGALNEVLLVDGVVFDLGGGSVQLSQVRSRRFVGGQALPLGALALTGRFIHSDPPKGVEYQALRAEVERALDEVSWLAPSAGPLVGMGGTVRNLARIDAARQSYPLQTLHGYRLSRVSIKESISLFRALPLAQRKDLPGLSSDRADIILAGATVINAIMARLGAESLTVSVNGLREGLFFEHFWSHLPYPVMPDIRRFGVLNLARLYHYQKGHSRHVRYLANSIFDQLAPLHGYGLAERSLLDAAALLHDIGTIVNYADHQLYSQALITANGLPGFTPRETALIALLARYHRKGKPDSAAYASLLEAGDGLLLARLAAILRLAEYLERGRNGAVADVAVTIAPDGLRLALIADEYPAVELWETARHAVPLAEAAFGCKVILESVVGPRQT